jgi:hypothetical protein
MTWPVSVVLAAVAGLAALAVLRLLTHVSGEAVSREAIHGTPSTLAQHKSVPPA